MGWIGTWRNQYGSTVTITDDSDDRIVGTFQTALQDSAFHGEAVPIIGMHRGNCISFTFSRAGVAGDTIASFTGLLRDGKMQTLWYVISDAALKADEPGKQAALVVLDWPHAAMANADTFERVD